MKTIVNERLVERQARLGKYALFGGMGVLVAGLVVSVARPQWLGLLLACLVVGMLASSFGSSSFMRWARRPRTDELLAQALKGFDDRYRLYSYYLPAPHVLLSPAGLFVLTAMHQDGKIHYTGARWRRNFSLGRALRFMAEEGLGRPDALSDEELAALRKWLGRQADAPEVEAHSALVFVHPKVDLDARDAPRPALLPKELGRFINKQRAAAPLSKATYMQLRRLFDQLASDAAG